LLSGPSLKNLIHDHHKNEIDLDEETKELLNEEVFFQMDGEFAEALWYHDLYDRILDIDYIRENYEELKKQKNLVEEIIAEADKVAREALKARHKDKTAEIFADLEDIRGEIHC
jgi:hypothetical protein